MADVSTISAEEIALSNSLIAAATANPETTDQMVATAASALLAGAVCGMLGLGDEGVSQEEYNEYATYIHARIEEFTLGLIGEITSPQPETKDN